MFAYSERADDEFHSVADLLYRCVIKMVVVVVGDDKNIRLRNIGQAM